MKLFILVCTILSVGNLSLAGEQSLSGKPEAGSYVTVSSARLQARRCLIDLGGFVTAGCLPSRSIKETHREPVATCSLWMTGENGVLEVFDAQGTSLRSYFLKDLATHDPSQNYSLETREDYKTIKTGLDISLGGWIGGPIVFVTSYEVTNIDVQFTAEGKIQKVRAEKNTDPTLLPGGTKLGKSLDKVLCNF